MKDIYDNFLAFNRYGFAHFFICFFAVTFGVVGIELLGGAVRGGTPFSIVGSSVVTVTSFVGALYEHNQKWQEDAVSDLIMNTVGCINGLAVAYALFNLFGWL